MKAQILEKLDEEIAKTEKELAPVNNKTHSYRSGLWQGLLTAREIVQKAQEEGVKHG